MAHAVCPSDPSTLDFRHMFKSARRRSGLALIHRPQWDVDATRARRKLAGKLCQSRHLRQVLTSIVKRLLEPETFRIRNIQPSWKNLVVSTAVDVQFVWRTFSAVELEQTRAQYVALGPSRFRRWWEGIKCWYLHCWEIVCCFAKVFCRSW